MTNSNNPIRCFEGTTQPHEAFWVVRDSVDAEEAEIEFYGYISEYSWLGDDITPQKFKKDLAKLEGKPVRLRINSYGGDLIAASLMSAMIKEYKGKVTVQIDGVAASAATLVALAGDEVQIQNTGWFMIHDPSYVFFLAQINLETMTRLADSLQSFKDGIMNAYEEKTGLSRTRLSKLMTDETWMDANKALALGFVDSIKEYADKKLEIPENTAVVNAIQNYTNVPPAILQAIQETRKPKAEESSDPKLTDEEEREAQTLRERIQTILRKEQQNA